MLWKPPIPLRRMAALAALFGPLASFGCGGEPPAPEEAGPDPHEPGPGIEALFVASPAAPAEEGDGEGSQEERVQAFYAGRGHQPAWTTREGLLPRGEALLAALWTAEREGLDPELYRKSEIEGLVAEIRARHEGEEPVGELLGRLDVLLTEALLSYAEDLARGTVDPEEAGLTWLVRRSDPPGADWLAAAAQAEDVGPWLESLRPASPVYGHLRDALARYAQIAENGGWPTVREGGKLAEGVRDPRVVEVRQRLMAEGDPKETALLAAAADPELFDEALSEAVSHFQERHGIDPDGAVGPATRAQMNVPAEERLLALKLNLDRWRWLPRDLGNRYVLVNVAGFELAVMENHQPVLRMNVVVGREGRNTPFFQDSLQYVVVNPYWNVPPTILRKDLGPQAARDPGYLARNGYEVLDRSGRALAGAPADLASGRYTVRQKPGPNNSLGDVKFLFPNSMDIYLHDTPARHLFQRTSRAYSSGCIRVEKPRELAEYLLTTAAGRPAGTYDKLRAAKKEQWVSLQEHIPIYILYFTAWAEGDGSVRFFGDVYQRDEAVGELARARFGVPGSPVELAAVAEEATR